MRRTTKLSHPRRLGLLPLRGAWLRLSMTLLVMMLTAMTAWAQGENYVASVTVGSTTTYYDVLQDDDDKTADAVSAAMAAYVPSSGDIPTITLLKDVNVGISLDFSTNNSGAAVILDLNGHNISSESNSTIYVDGGSLTVTGNGSINSSSYSAIYNNSGEVSIENGTFTSKSNYAISNFGILNVNGGTFSSGGTGEDGVAIKNYSVLTVDGGNFINSHIGIESIAWSETHNFTLAGLPTFSGNDIDIYLEDAFITFNNNITSAPTTPIKVSVSYTSCAFTINYSDYCANIHPTQMFQYANDGNYAFVALNTRGEALKIYGYQLLDGSDNSSTIEEWIGETAGVQLYGRTFYRNGDWNTLCLPFSLSNAQISMSNLVGAEIKELDASNSGLDSDGILTLTFKDATAGLDGNIIIAGKPYIVRWDATENFNDVIHPVFNGVMISETEPVPVTFDNAKGGDCQFVGQFSPFAITESTKNEILMLGSDNKLGYSKSARDLMCFRAHFLIPTTSGQAGARDFRINFGDEETTAIVSMEDGRRNTEDVNGIWYTLDGRRFDGKPTKKGVYIVNGKKIVIK